MVDTRRHLEVPTFSENKLFEPVGLLANSTLGNGSGIPPAPICSPLEYDLTKHRIIPVFYLVLCVVGVFGNGVVIKVLWTLMDKNNIKSVTDILVLNLAVADFIFVSSLPFWATEQFLQQRWVFGTVGCKLLSFITLLNLYGSVFFLVAMGIDRYLAVVFAVKARNYRTPRNAKIFCAVIWMFASLIGIEALVFRETNEYNCIKRCVWQLPGPQWNVTYFVLRVLFGFVLPFIVLVYCYVFIMMRLSKMAKSSRVQGSVTSNQQKITRAILAVISLFVLCWLPNHIITVMIAITLNDPSAHKRLHLNIANLFSVCLAYANSSINPILYAFMKTEIREEGTKMIKQMCCFSGDSRKESNADNKDRIIQHKPGAIQSKFAAFKQNIKRGNRATNAITTTVKKSDVADKENEPLCDQNSNIQGSPKTPPNESNTVILMVTTVDS